jgi:putative PEP-CTERM system TPR-repeat lipoprotein
MKKFYIPACRSLTNLTTITPKAHTLHRILRNADLGARHSFRRWCLFACALFLSSIAMPGHSSPEKAAVFYEDALKAFEKKDFAAATIQLKNAIQQDQKMLAAHLLLGKALIRSGDLKAAEAALEEAVRQGVSRGEVAVPLAQLYLALGFPSQVIDKVNASGLQPAVRVDVLTLRGTAYVETGNIKRAEESFAEARAADPKSVAPLVAEGAMYITQGQLGNARTLAEQAKKLDPENAAVWNLAASVAHATFDMKSALAAYDRALQIEPLYVDARVARAALLVDLKRDDVALKDLGFLRETALGDPRASYLRALLHAKQGESEKVSAALGEVAKLVDSLPPAWLGRREQILMVGALAHHGLRNFEKAREYLEILVARNGNNMAARKLLASIYVERRSFEKALPILESLQKQLPDDPQVQFMLGSAYMAKRRYVQATDLLEKAAARTGAPQMTRSLGLSQLGLGQIELGQASLEKAFAQNGADATAGMTLALLYIRRNMPQKALQVADGMVKRDPDNLAAINFLGSVHVGLGNKVEARKAFETALAKDAGFRPAVISLVRLDASDERYDDGRRRLNQLLAKKSDDALVLFELGMLERQARRQAEAVRHFSKANDIQKGDPRPGLALADIHMQRRDFDQALEVVKALASKFPDNRQVSVALGRAMLAVGDAPGARSVFLNMTRLAEYDPELQTAIGRLQLSAGNPAGALYNVQKALQGRPDDPAALALLVEVEAGRGDAAKADAALRQLTSKHPNSVEAAVTTGNLAMSRGQFQVAVTAFRNAAAREDSLANALNIARAMLAAGDAAKGAAFLTGWVAKHPKETAALHGLAEIQFRGGQLEEARRTYTKVLAAEPNDDVIMNNYANLLLALRDPAAKAVAETAVKLAPKNPAYVDTLGWVLVQQGELDAGLRYLRDARLRSPESPEVRFHLAYALAKSGRKSEARDELKVALTPAGRLPTSELLAELRKELGL